MSVSKFHEFIPKSFQYLKAGYNFSTFRKDLFAGITVGIIALPLAMAFAIASGVAPEKGLYTAIIAGFLISLLGGSRVQIGGPTGAFVVIVYGIIVKSGYASLAISTLIAALILVLIGIFRLGTFIKFIPLPLTTGFTTGIALIIFSSQMKPFFGFPITEVPASFAEQWKLYFQLIPKLDPLTLGVGLTTLFLILFIRRFIPKLPWGICSIVIATTVCWIFQIPVATIQSSFGEIPSRLPMPELPSLAISAGQWQGILIDALAIAFLGGIESLLSAVIADGMMGGRHKSNCELIAQGIANFGSVLFGGIPATGAIARTAANIKTGAQTPMAGMIHSLTLLFILLFLGPLASQIPLPSLAAVLIMVAWNMSEMGHFIRLLKSPFEDRAILLTAFLLTVFVNITFAIALGMVLACFLFMKRMSQIAQVFPLAKLFQETGFDFPEKSDPDAISKRKILPGIEVYEIQGPFFFGTTNILRDALSHNFNFKVFILRMRFVPIMDASGAFALQEFIHSCQKKGATVLLSGVQGHLRKDLDRYNLTHLVGESQIFPHIDAALNKANELLSSELELRSKPR